LEVLFKVNKPLFVNEIVRETGAYPNAVQRALLTLEKQEIVSSKRLANKKFYSPNTNHKFIGEIKSLTKNSKESHAKYPIWVKLVNRETSVSLNSACGVAQSKTKYLSRFRIKPENFLWYNSVTGGVYYPLEEIIQNGEILSQEIKNDIKFAKSLADSCKVDGENMIF
jgi:hypothetical protein